MVFVILNFCQHWSSTYSVLMCNQSVCCLPTGVFLGGERRGWIFDRLLKHGGVPRTSVYINVRMGSNPSVSQFWGAGAIPFLGQLIDTNEMGFQATHPENPSTNPRKFIHKRQLRNMDIKWKKKKTPFVAWNNHAKETVMVCASPFDVVPPPHRVLHSTEYLIPDSPDVVRYSAPSDHRLRYDPACVKVQVMYMQLRHVCTCMYMDGHPYLQEIIARGELFANQPSSSANTRGLFVIHRNQEGRDINMSIHTPSLPTLRSRVAETLHACKLPMGKGG